MAWGWMYGHGGGASALRGEELHIDNVLMTCSAQLVNPGYVALHKSRGLESPGLKLFMRATVLVADLLVLFPAALLFVQTYYRNKPWSVQVRSASSKVVASVNTSSCPPPSADICAGGANTATGADYH